MIISLIFATLFSLSLDELAKSEVAVLQFYLLSFTSHAIANPDVERAIRVIQAAPRAIVMPPRPNEVLDETTIPPVIKTYMVSGRAIGVTNCPGHEGAVIAYFTDPTGTVRTLSVTAKIDGRYKVLGDSDRDGLPETVVVDMTDTTGGVETLVNQEPGPAERRAYTEILICIGGINKAR